MKQKYNSFAAYLNLIEAQNEKNNKKQKPERSEIYDIKC
jgi:hypothetical protein